MIWLYDLGFGCLAFDLWVLISGFELSFVVCLDLICLLRFVVGFRPLLVLCFVCVGCVHVVCLLDLPGVVWFVAYAHVFCGSNLIVGFTLIVLVWSGVFVVLLGIDFLWLGSVRGCLLCAVWGFHLTASGCGFGHGFELAFGVC